MSLFFHRDLSWLSFNERILQEAQRSTVPLLERIKFLSIYSSNLDEFYRVRMPALLALQKINNKNNTWMPGEEPADTLARVQTMIQQQLELYGKILADDILPLLKQNNIELVYNQQQPPEIKEIITDYFFSRVLAFLQIIIPTKNSSFFPENNELYLAVLHPENGEEQLIFVNIPAGNLPRFFTTNADGKQYIIFLDDILRWNIFHIIPGAEAANCFSFKITRDAELDFTDDYSGDLAAQMEKQLKKRDKGLATRFLYQPGLCLRTLHAISRVFNLHDSSFVQGGLYHNLKDFASLPVKNKELTEPVWPQITNNKPETTLLSQIGEQDIIVHTPYQKYDTVLRFFNEAATNSAVQQINITLYRVASNSQIVQALITAAKNGKKVQAIVELKARFDEANNIKWAKKMKAAGVEIIYSLPSLKVHAKIALVKMKEGSRVKYRGLLATGNFNEVTANFYTDHILLTSNPAFMQELDLLFLFLAKRKKPASKNDINFQQLLVSQFNLHDCFLSFIDTEIENARKGLPAFIRIKLNNLEEETLITKLYEASQAGIKIELIIRSICRLIPGQKNLSENISVRRIVDKYLEHGRVFIFANGGNPKLYLGSADWMNRNIYQRVEVCFPVLDEEIKNQVLQLIDIQLQDNVQAVMIDEHLKNKRVVSKTKAVRSQEEIYRMLSKLSG